MNAAGGSRRTRRATPPTRPGRTQATDAYIGLGSNLDDPVRQVREALSVLAGLAATRLIASSSLYRTAPVGYRDQPDFINAVALLRTTLEPRALLEALLAVERQHGRLRAFANAPRTLDLDLLLYGDLVIREPGLVIPHPRLHERGFVLVPLAEIAPALMVPGRGRVGGLLSTVDASDVTRVGPAPGRRRRAAA